MDEADSGSDVLQSQIEELMHEKSPQSQAEKMMELGNTHRDMLIEVVFAIGRLVKQRWISPGDAYFNDKVTIKDGNAANKMMQTFRKHGTITQVHNFATEDARRTFMQEHQLRRDTDIGFAGCYVTSQQ